MIAMGYTHGKKWNDSEIIKSILIVKDWLGIDRMPTKKECDEYYGNFALSNAISRRKGGWYGLAKVLNLDIKESETTLGKVCEATVRAILLSKGFCAEQMRQNFRLVKEIQNLIKPSAEAIAEFKKEVIKIAKTAEEYNELFKEDEDIVTFVRKNVEFLPSAVDAFLDKEKNKGLNEDQLKYIKELLLFISQNGDFKRQYLLRSELLFGELFNSSQINDLIVDIEEII